MPNSPKLKGYSPIKEYLDGLEEFLGILQNKRAEFEYCSIEKDLSWCERPISYSDHKYCTWTSVWFELQFLQALFEDNQAMVSKISEIKDQSELMRSKGKRVTSNEMLEDQKSKLFKVLFDESEAGVLTIKQEITDAINKAKLLCGLEKKGDKSRGNHNNVKQAESHEEKPLAITEEKSPAITEEKPPAITEEKSHITSQKQSDYNLNIFNSKPLIIATGMGVICFTAMKVLFGIRSELSFAVSIGVSALCFAMKYDDDRSTGAQRI